MLRALWFTVKICLLLAAVIWAANYPGTVQISWLGYTVTAHVAVVILTLLIALLVALFLHRVFLAILQIPKMWSVRKQNRTRELGHRNLTLGMSAVAAGDAGQAKNLAAQVRRMLPDDKGLTLLLEAQAERLNGSNESARHLFEKMLKSKDTSFLGLRGLLSMALEDGQLDTALTYARKALDMHARQPWILKTVYDLEVKLRHWNEAEKMLIKAEKLSVLTNEQAKSDRVAMLLYQAETLEQQNKIDQAIKKALQAHKIDHASVPAALAAAKLSLKKEKPRAAVKIIEESWSVNPHPELAALWIKLAPENTSKDSGRRLRWMEKLVSINTTGSEAYLAAASAAIDDNIWGEAEKHLDAAEQIRTGARLYRLRAKLEEKQNRIEAAKTWHETAANAPADPVWVCKATGRIYDHWSSIAQPHGSFNTIIWDFPQARHEGRNDDNLLSARHDLLINPPSSKAA